MLTLSISSRVSVFLYFQTYFLVCVFISLDTNSAPPRYWIRQGVASPTVPPLYSVESGGEEARRRGSGSDQVAGRHGSPCGSQRPAGATPTQYLAVRVVGFGPALLFPFYNDAHCLL